MREAVLIGVLIALIVAAMIWAARAYMKGRREGYTGWNDPSLPADAFKFADRSGGCSPGFLKVTDGNNKGMCVKADLIAKSLAPVPYKPSTQTPAPAPTPAPRSAPPKAQPPVRKQNWLEKLSESQDPLSAGKGGSNAKPVVYNQGSNRQRPNITIASSGSKFRPKQGDGKCPAGYSEIMSGERKGMCVKSEYARGGTPAGPSRVSGSKFSSKVNGQCPNGSSEITSGTRKGMCIKWEYAGKPSGSGGSSRPSNKSPGSSGSKFTSKIDGKCPQGTSEITAGGHKGHCYIGGSSGGSSGKSSGKSSDGSTNYGSKFTPKANGKCPSGTTEITAGSRKGQCIKNAAKGSIKYNQKNVGSIYKAREAASCPKGTTLVKSGAKKGMCIDEGKVVNREYKYWGWGPNAGLRCKNSNNTGCETKWVGGKLVDTKKNPVLKKFQYWGWGKNAGLLCSSPNNTGCETKWSGGKLVENKQAPKPAPKPSPAPSSGIHWGWGPNAGMQCKNADNTGCSWDYTKKPEPKIQTPGFGANWTPGWGGNKGMKCRGTVPNTNCSWN